ncbi:MAG: ABC transporter permease [Desulfurococcaceae archaeon]
MLKLVRRASAVFKAYLLSELVRSRGFIYVLLNIALWITMFSLPAYMFVEEPASIDTVATNMFTGIMIFLFYSMASWDWAAEIRWMINDGRIEYYIATGAGFLPHYLGILPVSLIWLLTSLLVNYAMLSIIWTPPRIVIQNPLIFTYGFILLVLTLLAYALILGGTMISTGVAGFIVEIISFILPIATGGLIPLRSMPIMIQRFALLTPFSYPAEIIRDGFLGVEPVISIEALLLLGTIYVGLFTVLGIMYFKYQLRRAMKTGFKTVSMW